MHQNKGKIVDYALKKTEWLCTLSKINKNRWIFLQIQCISVFFYFVKDIYGNTNNNPLESIDTWKLCKQLKKCRKQCYREPT